MCGNSGRQRVNLSGAQMSVTSLVSIDDKLFSLRMKVADDNDLSDVVVTDAEVSCEQRAGAHVNQASYTDDVLTQFIRS